MTGGNLTVREAWQNHSVLGLTRKIYVKRRKTDGTYEAEYSSIEDLLGFDINADNLIGDIAYSLPNETFSLGSISINNAQLNFLSPLGEMADESRPDSIFATFIRNKSLIKIVDTFTTDADIVAPEFSFYYNDYRDIWRLVDEFRIYNFNNLYPGTKYNNGYASVKENSIISMAQSDANYWWNEYFLGHMTLSDLKHQFACMQWIIGMADITSYTLLVAGNLGYWSGRLKYYSIDTTPVSAHQCTYEKVGYDLTLTGFDGAISDSEGYIETETFTINTLEDPAWFHYDSVSNLESNNIFVRIIEGANTTYIIPKSNNSAYQRINLLPYIIGSGLVDISLQIGIDNPIGDDVAGINPTFNNLTLTRPTVSDETTIPCLIEAHPVWVEYKTAMVDPTKVTWEDMKIFLPTVNYRISPEFSPTATHTLFEGFIDDKNCSTDINFKEKIQAVDVLMELLKNTTIQDIGATTETELGALVYEIINRAPFTNFFTVDADNIAPPVTVSIDLSQYDNGDSLFDVFKDISAGHSIFYSRDGIFYYQPINPGLVLNDSGKYSMVQDFEPGNGTTGAYVIGASGITSHGIDYVEYSEKTRSYYIILDNVDVSSLIINLPNDDVDFRGYKKLNIDWKYFNPNHTTPVYPTIRLADNDAHYTVDISPETVENLGINWARLTFNIDTVDLVDKGKIIDILLKISSTASVLNETKCNIDNIYLYDKIEGLLTINQDRQKAITNFNNGAKAVKEKIYWADTADAYFGDTNIYDTSHTLDIKGITDRNSRLEVLNYVGKQVSVRRPRMTITIPYMPDIFLLDLIKVYPVKIVDGGFQLDIDQLNIDAFGEAAAKYPFEYSDLWVVRRITHSGSLETKLTIERVN